MSKLTRINIDTLLNEKLDQFFSQPQTYTALREHCLNVRPISSINDSISSQLTRLAEEDKEDEKTALTGQAYQQQMVDDQEEFSNDKTLAQKYSSRRAEIRKELIIKRQEHAALTTQIMSINSQLRSLNVHVHVHPNLQSHVHVHPQPQSQVHVHPHSQPATKIMLESRLQQLETQQSTLNSAISTLGEEEANLSKEDSKIHQRAKSRFQRSQGNSLETSLTARNFDKLTQDIQKKHKEIDDLLARMKDDAAKKCHSVFLNKLDLNLQSSVIQFQNNSENHTLLKIILFMKTHVQDLNHLATEEALLSNQQNNLDKQRRLRITTLSSTASKRNENEHMRQENADLNRRNEELMNAKDSLLATRKSFGTATLIATIITLCLAPEFFLLTPTLAYTAPFLSTLLPVITISIIVGLATVSLVSWIRAQSKQSEYDNNVTKREDNIRHIQENESEISKLDNSNLPQIDAKIRSLTTEIEIQQQRVQEARAKAEKSLAEARAINTPLSAELQHNSSSARNTATCGVRVTQGGHNMFPSQSDWVVLAEQQQLAATSGASNPSKYGFV